MIINNNSLFQAYHFVCRLLDFKDLLIIECVSKAFSALVEPRWKSLLIDHQYVLLIDSPKKSFLFQHHLKRYLSLKKHSHTSILIQKVQTIFSSIEKTFPSLWAYIVADAFQTYGHPIPPEIASRTINQKTPMDYHGNDLILYLLSYLKINRHLANDMLVHIKSMASVAFKISPHMTKAKLLKFSQEMSPHKKTQELIYPTLLFELAKQQQTLFDTANLMTEALDSFKRLKIKPTPQISLEAGEAFFNQTAWQKADECYSDVLASLEGNIPLWIWSRAGYIKLKLKEWNQADAYLTKVVDQLTPLKTPPAILAQIGLAKTYLAQWEDSSFYYSLAIALSNGSVEPQTYFEAGRVFFYRGQTKTANDLFAKAINLNFRSAELYHLAGMAKANLEDWRGAHAYYEIAKGLFEIVPLDFWVNFSVVCFKLNLLKDARIYIERAEAVYQGNLPADACAFIAFLKKESHKWKEADHYYTKAIAAYGENMPPQIWYEAGFTKYQLENYFEASECYWKAILGCGLDAPELWWYELGIVSTHVKDYNFDQISNYMNNVLDLYGKNPPRWLWEQIGKVSFWAEKYEKADEYFSKAIDVYKKAVRDTVLFFAARTKVKLKQWKKAEVLFMKIEKLLNADIPLDVWHDYARTNVALKQWDLADRYFRKAILLKRHDINPHVLIDAGYVKLVMNDLKLANQYLTQAVNAIETQKDYEEVNDLRGIAIEAFTRMFLHNDKRVLKLELDLLGSHFSFPTKIMESLIDNEKSAEKNLCAELSKWAMEKQDKFFQILPILNIKAEGKPITDSIILSAFNKLKESEIEKIKMGKRISPTYDHLRSILQRDDAPFKILKYYYSQEGAIQFSKAFEQWALKNQTLLFRLAELLSINLNLYIYMSEKLVYTLDDQLKAKLMLAIVSAKLQNWIIADQYFTYIITNNPSLMTAEAWHLASLAKEKFEYWDQSFDCCKESLKLYKDDIPLDVLKQAGKQFFRKNQFQDATVYLKKAIERDKYKRVGSIRRQLRLTNVALKKIRDAEKAYSEVYMLLESIPPLTWYEKHLII